MAPDRFPDLVDGLAALRPFQFQVPAPMRLDLIEDVLDDASGLGHNLGVIFHDPLHGRSASQEGHCLVECFFSLLPEVERMMYDEVNQYVSEA